MTDRELQIKLIANKYGWLLLCRQEENYMISFYKEDMRINVWYTKMTVATCLNHPVQGKTQLFRRKVSDKLLHKIFEYPRVHTHKGYFTK
jgi:hypothetical protein